jgi:hypothetical protein
MTTHKQQPPENEIHLGSMRNSHPLLGSERYRNLPYAGWKIAKEVCLPTEVIEIFNGYLVRAYKSLPFLQLLSGTTWEEVEASALTPGDIYECMCFPGLPDFYRLLARKTGKTIVVGNHSMKDSAGFFHEQVATRYLPDGNATAVTHSINNEIPF